MHIGVDIINLWQMTKWDVFSDSVSDSV